MKVRDNTESSKFLSSICQNSLSFSTKFARFSFASASIPKLAEKAVLLLQYIQLLSQIFLFNANIVKNYSAEYSDRGVQVVIQTASFFQPGYWISFQNQHAEFIVISVIFLLFLALRYLLFAYICAISLSDNVRVNHMLIKIWRFIFMLQCRVLCMFFASFWVNAAVAFLRNEIEDFLIGDSAVILVCATLSILEFAFSFFLQIKFCYMLPTKSFFASKNNDLEIWILFQKFILQLLQVILANATSSVSIWIVVCVNLLLSLAAKSIFLATLPLYNLQALKYLAILLAAAITLNISCFFKAVALKYFESQEDELKFLIIIWTILACFGVRISYMLLDQLFLKLVSINSFSLSPQLLIHKVILINKIRKSWTQPVNEKGKSDFYLLLTQGILSNLNNILSQNDFGEIKTLQDMEDKNSLDKVFTQYIDQLLLQNSKNKFIKLYSSYFYAKKLGYFAYATKFIKELSSLQANLTASILQIEIQNLIHTEYLKHRHILDIFTYLHEKEQVTQLKTKMLSQAGIQADIYKEILSETPDLAKVFDDSQKVNRLSFLIEKKMKNHLQDKEEAQIELCILFYEYSQKLNYSMSSIANQENLYLKRIERFQRLWRNYDKDSNIENICQERFPVFTLSGQRADAGKIVYCSKAAEKLIGQDKSKILGSHVSYLAPSCIENFLIQGWRSTSEKADSFHFSFLHHLLIYHQDGYLVKTQGTTNIHPFVGQGIFFNVVVNPFGNSTRDYILIEKNGDIDCASEKIAKRLNLLIKKKPKDFMQKPHIREVCQELERVNQALNIVDCEKRKGEIEKEFENYEMDLQEAKEIFSHYKTSGQDLILTSPTRKHISSLYSCKIEMMDHGDEYLKILILEERNYNQKALGQVKAVEQILTTQESSRKNLSLTLKNKETFEYDETEVVQSEFEEEKPTFMLETTPFKTPKTSRFLRDTSPHIPNTDTHFLTYENPNSCPLKAPNSERPFIFASSPTHIHPMETGDLSSKRLLFQQQQQQTERASSPFKQVGKKPAHLVEGSVQESIRCSKEKKIDAAYRAALNAKFQPKYFRAFNIAFFSVIIAIMVTHGLYHHGIDSKVDNLSGKKEVLSNAQLTNYYLIQSAGVFRVLQDAIVQRFTASELGIFNFPAEAYIFFSSPILINLNDANQNLIVSTDTLTQENRKYIFSSDVPIYHSYFDSLDQGSLDLTSFEGTNRVIETGLAAMDQTTKNLTSGLENFKFIYRNALNDLLLKNTVIATFFFTSFMEEFEEIGTLTKKFLIGTPLFIISILAALIFIIVKQYNQDKLNLSSIPKLNNIRLKEILASIQEFIIIVEADELVSDEFLDKILDGEQQSKKFNTKANEPKRGLDKSLNDKKITKKYVLLLLQAFFLFMGLLVIVILHLLITKKSVDFFLNKQIQISFCGDMRGRIYLSEIASQELFSAPASAKIEDIPVAPWAAQSIRLMQTLRLAITETLLSEDASIDPEIQNIILENGCTESVQATSPGSCPVLEQKGVKTGLMYLLSTLESIFDSRQNLYEQSDKSEQALRDIEAIDFEILLTATLVLVGQCEVITDILNRQVEKNLALADHQRDITTALAAVFIIILVILIWLFIIRKLKDSFDNFKKVLKIFPADLALSSFILKTFLRKTSGGALDSIKSDI